MRILLGICVAIVLVIGGFLMLNQNPDPVLTDLQTGIDNEHHDDVQATSTEVYQSQQYGFNFTVPEGQSIHEYSSEFISVGQPIENGFTAEAEVTVSQSGEESGYEDFDTFLFDSSLNVCAADGPTGTIYCEEVVRQNSFTTQSGLVGTEFYLSRIYENFTTGERTEEEFGPFIAFKISEDINTSDYEALVIRPSAAAGENINPSLINMIAETVQLVQ